MKNLNWLIVICFGAAVLGGLIGGGIVITIVERPVVRIPSEVIVRAPSESQTSSGTLPEEVEAEPKTNVVGAAILIGALILLVIGIAVLTIRLSRH